MKRVWFLTIIIYILSAELFSQPNIVNVRVSPDSITIGDRININVSLRLLDSASVNLKSWKDQLPETCEFYDQQLNIQSTDTISAHFIIAAFDTGEITLAPVVFEINKYGKDSISYQLGTDSIRFHVYSILPDTAKNQIKPAKLPVAVSFPWKKWVLWGLIILAGLLIIFLIYRYIKRRQKGTSNIETISTEPEVNPFDLATEQLARLKDEVNNNQLGIQAGFTRLSHILRNFIELQFRFPALEYTTYEIKHHLGTLLEDMSLRDSVIQILQLADLVKFAKHEPSMLELKENISLAEKWLISIKQTIEKNQMNMEKAEEEVR